MNKSEPFQMDREKAIAWFDRFLLSEKMMNEEAASAIKFAVADMRRGQHDDEPLTLEQLREMDGAPVWIVDTKHPEDSGWMQYSYYSAELYMVAFWMFGDEVERTYSVENYGKTWLAYRRQPEIASK